jgi:hypothetical protein
MASRVVWLGAAVMAAGWRCQSPPAPASKVHAGLDGPRAVVAADLDGDGDPDVAVAEAGAGRAAIFVNQGGVLTGPRSFPAGVMPSDVRAADLDGDGDLDLILANHETSLLSVLRNDGRAGFIADAPLDAGSRPHHHGVAVADLDGDGALDLAVDSSGDDTVRVLLGARAPARALTGCALPYYKVAAADVSGDGVADLLVPCQRSRSLAVFAGAREVVATVALPSTPWVVSTADLDGDRRPEVIVVLDDSVAVLRGDTRSGFTPVPGSPFAVAGATEVAAGDVDGDGIADLAVGPWESDEVTVFLGGSFRRASLRAATRPVGLTVADLDGDGRAEVIAASAVAGTLHVVGLSP